MMQDPEYTHIMTHAALVAMEGDIDASLAPSYEAALELLRERAQTWDWEIDPEHPLDRAHATLEQLSTLYADGAEGESQWVSIAILNTPYAIRSDHMPSQTYHTPEMLLLLAAHYRGDLNRVYVYGTHTNTCPLETAVPLPIYPGTIGLHGYLATDGELDRSLIEQYHLTFISGPLPTTTLHTRSRYSHYDLSSETGNMMLKLRALTLAEEDHQRLQHKSLSEEELSAQVDMHIQAMEADKPTAEAIIAEDMQALRTLLLKQYTLAYQALTVIFLLAPKETH